MQIYPLTDLTLTGSAQQVFPEADLPGRAQIKWFQVQFVSNASGLAARLGNINVAANKGVVLGPGAGGGQFAPPIAEMTSLYDARAVYVIGTAGDTMARAYAL